MRKFFKTLFLTMLAGAVTAAGTSLFACSAGAAVQNGKSAYDIWLEQGNTGTEQDFLDSLKGDQGIQGPKGDQGETPEITVGSNGNWFVDGKDTGVKAQGDKGDPGNPGKDGPQVFSGEHCPKDGSLIGVYVASAEKGDIYICASCGYLWEFVGPGDFWDDVCSLKGPKGDKGDDASGSGWHVGNTAPLISDGAAGDLWLNTEDGHVWYKEAGGWKDLGSLKEGEAVVPEKDLIKNFGPVSLKSGEASALDLSNVSNGKYFLIVETSSEVKANTLIAKTYSSTAAYENYDMYAPVSKTYKSIVNKGDNTILELTASEDMTVNAKLVELGSVPTVTAEGGKAEFEIPALTSANVGGFGGMYVVKLDETLAGKKGVTITVETDYIAKIYVNAANDYETSHTTDNNTILKQFDAAPFTATIDLPDNGYIYIRSNRLHLNANVRVTIRLN